MAFVFDVAQREQNRWRARCHSGSASSLSSALTPKAGGGEGPGALTEGQLEASVQQEAMGSRVLGAVDLVRLHQDLGVQEDPVPRTLLEAQTHSIKTTSTHLL